MEGTRINPWIGLQTYVEGSVLYGRDEEIRILSQYILTDSETVLYGKSGVGKSSVLNAGVIPIARLRGIIPINIRLAHEKDAEAYVIQIYNKIRAAGITCGDFKEGMQLWELFHSNSFTNEKGERVRLMIVFDQFEEIFTLQQNTQKKIDFFKQLADQINGIMPRSLSGKESENNIDEQKEVMLKTMDGGMEIVLDNMDFSLSDESVSRHYDNDIHFVFTLREDFLSEFDYYTSSIPSFKQHRYGLRPISEEQAAEIIMKPCPGLASKEVAKLIIEKVTNRTDFKLDGKPEIEVNSAVLSLYLSKFYDKSGGAPFTKELIEKEAGNIINEFYNECIDGIPENIVEKLENVLVNKEGHRENKSLRVLSEELNAGEYIRRLIDRKLLSAFQYAGETKVEFIHDILCGVVQTRKEEKEKRQEQLLLLHKQNRRNRMGLYGLSFLVFLTSFTIVYLALSNNRLKNEHVFGGHQTFTVKFIEDPDVIKDNDFWHAHFQLIGINGERRDTIFEIADFNKSLKDSTFRFVADSIKSFYYLLDFDRENNKKYYVKIEGEKPMSYLSLNKELRLNIKFDNSRMKTYKGRVYTLFKDEPVSLQDAIVVLRGQALNTDRDGFFKFSLEDSLNNEDNVYIIRSGFATIERPALDNNRWNENWEMISADSLSGFISKSERIDSIDKWNYKVVEKYTPRQTLNGDENENDKINFFAKINGRNNDGNFIISGYYYYDDEYRELEDNEKFYSYHFFSGWMDSTIQTRTSGPLKKPFKVEAYDKVGNKEIINGYRKRNGRIEGFVVNKNDTIAALGEHSD